MTYNPRLTTGPSSSSDNSIVRFDGTTGTFVQNSTTTLQDDGYIRGQNSTAALPLYSFTSSTSTGIFSPAANQIGFSTGGTNRATLSSSSLSLTVPTLLPDGNEITPSLTFSADTDTGLFRVGSNLLGVAGAGKFIGYFGTSGSNGYLTLSPDSASTASSINLQYGSLGYSAQMAFSSGGFTIYAPTDGYHNIILRPSDGSELRTSISGTTVSATALSDGYGTVTMNGPSGSQIQIQSASSARGRLVADEQAVSLISSTSRPLIFKTNDLEQIRIDSSGRLGINQQSPSAMIDVVGDSGQIGLKINTSSAQWATLVSDTTVTNYMSMFQAGTSSALGYIGAGDGAAVSASAGAFSTDLAIRAESGRFMIARGNTVSMQYDTYGMVAMDPVVQLPPPIIRISAKGSLGGTSLENSMITTPTQTTPGGAATSDDTATMMGIRYSTQAVSGTSAGWNHASYNVQTTHGFTFFASFMPRNSMADVRYWVAVANTNPIASDAPSGTHIAGFRYSTGTDSTWRCFTNDGVGTPVEATYVSGITVPTPALDVRQNLAIRVLNNGTRIEFWASTGTPGIGATSSGTGVYKHIATATSNLPGTTTNLGYFILVEAKAAATKQIAISAAGYITTG